MTAAAGSDARHTPATALPERPGPAPLPGVSTPGQADPLDGLRPALAAALAAAPLFHHPRYHLHLAGCAGQHPRRRAGHRTRAGHRGA